MIPWMADSLLAFLVALTGVVVVCLLLELSYLAYDRVCYWLQERERRR